MNTDRSIKAEARRYAEDRCVSYARARQVIFDPMRKPWVPVIPGYRTDEESRPHHLITGPMSVLMQLRDRDRDAQTFEPFSDYSNADIWIRDGLVGVGREMDSRQQRMSALGCRSLLDLRRLEREGGRPTTPFIRVYVRELDRASAMMMSAATEVIRKGRSSGIQLVANWDSKVYIPVDVRSNAEVHVATP